jgi:hypothetical protein
MSDLVSEQSELPRLIRYPGRQAYNRNRQPGQHGLEGLGKPVRLQLCWNEVSGHGLRGAQVVQIRQRGRRRRVAAIRGPHRAGVERPHDLVGGGQYARIPRVVALLELVGKPAPQASDGQQPVIEGSAQLIGFADRARIQLVRRLRQAPERIDERTVEAVKLGGELLAGIDLASKLGSVRYLRPQTPEPTLGLFHS